VFTLVTYLISIASSASSKKRDFSAEWEMNDWWRRLWRVQNVAWMVETRNTYRTLLVRALGDLELRRLKRKYSNNKVDFWKCVVRMWIRLFRIMFYDWLLYVCVCTLCLTKHHAMKTYWGMEVKLHTFLTVALEGGEWSASRPGRFTPRERVPSTHWIGGWVSH